MPDSLDTLQMALLSVCRDSREPLHSLHAHAEDWLARPLGSDEVDAAIRAMERGGLITAFRFEGTQWVAVRTDTVSAPVELRFLATPAGTEAATAAWQQFFAE
jgi:DNA-binding response OmpR family regulator